MSREQASMMRNTAWLMLQRVALIASGILYAALVPRLMGPDMYGRFALMMSLAMWCMCMSELGFTQIQSRYIPAQLLSGGMDAVRRLFGNLLSIRVIAALPVVFILIGALSLLVPDADTVTLLTAGAFTYLWSVSNNIFGLFLGLNRAARWGMGPIVRRWSYPILISVGWFIGGLHGAVFGVLLAELAVLALGLSWSHAYIRRDALRPDFHFLRPMLRFGLGFFGAALIHVTFRQSGETLIRLVTKDYTQVAYYGVAFSAYISAEAAILQLLQSMVPFLSRFAIRQEFDKLSTWVERLLRTMTVAVMPVLFGAIFLADEIVPLVFGRAYAPASVNLIPMAAAVIAFALACPVHLVCVVMERPSIAFQAAVLRWMLFWAVSVPLILSAGSFGACLGAFVATVVAAGVFTYRVQRILRYSLGRWALAVGAGLLFTPLAVLSSTWKVDVALFAAAVQLQYKASIEA